MARGLAGSTDLKTSATLKVSIAMAALFSDRLTATGQAALSWVLSKLLARAEPDPAPQTRAGNSAREEIPSLG